ncbi:MAG TPA: CRTAC1 family protein [Verrucomicrobiae bacterium]|nr:CRTAC1 family protein [Verrucomicrobiae bacterium]
MNPRLAVVLVLAAVVAASTFAWQRRAPRFDMAARLAAIAAGQDLWENQFERNAEKAAALAAAAQAERNPQRRYELALDSARQHALAAQAEAAIATLRALLDLTWLSREQREAVKQELALAYLRMGESQNCVWNHSADSCLIPISPDGVHAQRLGSSQAAMVLEGLLADPAASPAQVPAWRWLLNVARMTLGEYPDNVVPRWRIPESAFASGYALPRFRDVAAVRGLKVQGRAGGAVVDDFDGDGALDVFVSSWGQADPLRLFLNDGRGTFREVDPGLPGINGGLDLFQGDYDNDGRLDVFVPRGAWAHRAGRFPPSLLHNEGGGRFRDVTAEAGLLDELPSQAAVWCDLDNDGWLDLVKGNELHADVAWPADTRNVALFHNDRRGAFTDVAVAAGVLVRGMIKGVVCGDIDNDGWQDLYFSVIYGDNVLLRNLGVGGALRFEDVTRRAGVAAPRMSFTTWFFDYDNDGWQDLYVAGYLTDMANLTREVLGERGQGERPRLYRNNADGTFTDVAPALGVDALSLTMGANYGDLDNDGWLDFYLGTGAPPLQILDPSRMYRNDRGQRFQDVTTAGGFGHVQKGHAVAFGDVDGDGDQDVFEEIGGAFTGDRFWSVLFDNPTGNRPGANDWITLRLRGVQANRAAIGARLRLRARDADGPREIHATVSSGGSFGANSLQQELGLGRDATLESIEVRWPGSGRVQVLAGPIAVNRAYELVEGEPALRPSD